MLYKHLGHLVLFVKDITGKFKNDPGFFEQLEKFVDLDSENRSGIYSGFTYSRDEAAHKSLVVVFDATIAKEIYYKKKKTAFHIVFVTAKERNIIDQMNIPELSALSFVHFKGGL